MRRGTSSFGALFRHGPVVAFVLLVAVFLAYAPIQIPFRWNRHAANPAVISVGVLSACANFDRRAAVRATWGKSDAFHAVDFFLGICKSKDILEQVIREQAIHGDIVMAPKTESYEHITHQTMHMMTVLSHDDRVTHVFKTDDDSYIKPDRLRALLDDLLEAHGREQQMLVGHIEHVSSPIRDPNNKWCVRLNDNDSSLIFGRQSTLTYRLSLVHSIGTSQKNSGHDPRTPSGPMVRATS